MIFHHRDDFSIPKRGVFSALAAFAYVAVLVGFMSNIERLAGTGEDSVLAPVVALLLLVLSASVMGLLIFASPILLYIDGKKKEAVQLMGWTIGSLAVITVITLTTMILISARSAGTDTQSAGTTPAYAQIPYLVDGRAVTMGKGGAAYFGNEASGDADGDGDVDTAFLFTVDAEGSGTFFYFAVALKNDSGYTGTEAVLLGDRVAPQPTTFKDGLFVVNYADRQVGEPMTARPSMGISRWFAVSEGRLNEVTSR